MDIDQELFLLKNATCLSFQLIKPFQPESEPSSFRLADNLDPSEFSLYSANGWLSIVLAGFRYYFLIAAHPMNPGQAG